ncbi:MAG TPA: DUF559 domain-containing protein [Nocardioidaceae bacterium]|nr:DUF559 domain-containing protein [Nocardioidaceae bacterium]
MDLLDRLAQLGGIASRAALIELTSRTEVDRAIAHGGLVRDGHGRYSLPAANAALRAANALTGIVSHRTAALHWSWEVKSAPTLPDVTVRSKRHLSPAQRSGAILHWGEWTEDDVQGLVTSPRRTLVDCVRSLPFDEALSIADSALRHGSVSSRLLVSLADALRGRGAAQARRVAHEATGLAANPFESVLRAIALGVEGLDFKPQSLIKGRNFSVQPDLVDSRRRIVLEADSFAWHSDRAALRMDAQRYNNLVVRGFLVLRFAWEDVMHDQDYVRRTLTALAKRVNQQDEPGWGPMTMA